jgi:nicotinamidase/pyrazinamidase
MAGSVGFDHAVATRDHHVDPGTHFSTDPDFVDSWPPHCVVGTPGAELHPELAADAIEAVFDKGEHAAASAGFATTVPLDLTAGVARSTVEAAVGQLAAAGVNLRGEPVVAE